MIDFDYGPAVLIATVAVAYIGPFVVSLFIDNYDKKSPQIKS